MFTNIIQGNNQQQQNNQQQVLFSKEETKIAFDNLLACLKDLILNNADNMNEPQSLKDFDTNNNLIFDLINAPIEMCNQIIFIQKYATNVILKYYEQKQNIFNKIQEYFGQQTATQITINIENLIQEFYATRHDMSSTKQTMIRTGGALLSYYKKTNILQNFQDMYLNNLNAQQKEKLETLKKENQTNINETIQVFTTKNNFIQQQFQQIQEIVDKAENITKDNKI